MKNKYKILVLLDLDKSLDKKIQNAVNLGKIINADLDFFSVKPAADIVKKENQFSAVRTLNEEYNTTDKKIKSLLTPILEKYEGNINYSFSFGNVKNEIEDYIIKTNPDIIILGKRKAKIIGFAGDNITDFILSTYKGSVMIVSENSNLNANEDISLGFLNGDEVNFDIQFLENLLSKSQKPLKSFRIGGDLHSLNESKTFKNKPFIEYVFEQNNDTIKNISNYIDKSSIDLLCINKENQKTKSEKADIKNVISLSNVSLFLTNNNF